MYNCTKVNYDGIIREYGSTLYVGWHGKKMAAYTFQLQVMS